MKKENFQNLIQLVTGRDLIINSNDIELQFEKDYCISRELPITKHVVSFKWKTPKTEDKMLRSLITAFCSKYIEPDPKTYDYKYGNKEYKWDWLTEKEKEYCYFHHRGHMFNKTELLNQIEQNFNNPNISTGLLKYGFYETNYGIGIFSFWMTNFVQSAINEMNMHLKKLSIPYTNEFSEAKWVYRFKIGISKESHLSIINQLNN